MSKRFRPNAGIVLFWPQADGPSRVFVGRRFDDVPYPWQLPQGGIDAGEDPRAAALRELEEETGVPASAVDVVGETKDWLPYEFPPEVKTKLFKGKYDGQTQKWFALRLKPKVGESVINIKTAEPEFAEWKWVTYAEALNLVVPFKRPLYREVHEELGGLVG